MPPKKKKSGKKSSKKGSKASATVTKAVKLIPKIDEVGKDFFLIQIRDLEKRISRLQTKCDELELMNETFFNRFDQVTTDKQEICDYLKLTLQEKADEIMALNDELNQLQEACDAEKEMYFAQMDQLKSDFAESKEQLTSENMILSGKLASLEEFRIQKEALMLKFEQIEEEIARTAQEYKEQLYQLERQCVVDKDKLKKEMVVRVNDVASEFRKVSNKQMAETTKRTIQENADLNRKLLQMSQRTMSIIAEFDSLKEKCRNAERENEILETVEMELANKSQANIKTIKTLIEQCREKEAIILDFEAAEKNHLAVDVENQILASQFENQKEELGSLNSDNKRLNSEVQTLETALAKQKRLSRKINRLLNTTRVALANGESLLHPDEEMTESEAVNIRQRMITTLLFMLDSAAELGVGPEPGNLGRGGKLEQYEYSPQEHVTSSANQVTAPDLMTERLSEFGLAPRPDSSINKGVIGSELTRALSPIAAQNLEGRSLKRVPKRSAGCQAGAMFYASSLLSQLPNASRIITREPQNGRGLAATDKKLKVLAAGKLPVPAHIF